MQEGHTAHATPEEAEEETIRMLRVRCAAAAGGVQTHSGCFGMGCWQSCAQQQRLLQDGGAVCSDACPGQRRSLLCPSNRQNVQSFRDPPPLPAQVYEDFACNVAAMPVIAGRKSRIESFAGANCTYTIEAMMGDRKALQVRLGTRCAG